MEKFHRNPNKDFVNLITHIVTQSFEALYRLKESDDIFELVQEFKQSILRWEQKGSEYLHQDPFWNEQIPQMKFTIDLLANEHVLSLSLSQFHKIFDLSDFVPQFSIQNLKCKWKCLI
jgi:2-C-methyl-D-erythritol 4-phosphate cytidylyltransferase